MRFWARTISSFSLPGHAGSSAELERERLIEARVQEQRVHVERLADLNRLLEETAEEKRRFVSMVLHDLRHPLTTLRTSLYLLRIEPDEQQRLSHLSALENRTKALSGLLDELVLYDPIEAGQPTLKMNRLIWMRLSARVSMRSGPAHTTIRWLSDVRSMRTWDRSAVTGANSSTFCSTCSRIPLNSHEMGLLLSGRTAWTLEWQLEVEDADWHVFGGKAPSFDEYFLRRETGS